MEEIIKPVPADGMAEQRDQILHQQPDRSFCIGGPMERLRPDRRKIIVDTYGGGCSSRRRRVLW